MIKSTGQGESITLGKLFSVFGTLQEEIDKLTAEAADRRPRLTVKILSFPETNGKRNWTVLLTREEPWDGLAGNCGGITISRGEFWNRVAYDAERTRFLIGERDTEPSIIDYSEDILTPDQWAGESVR